MKEGFVEKKFIIFYLWAYNDIDHIVPVIDRIYEQKPNDVELIVLTTDVFNNYNDDYRIKYLRKKNIFVTEHYRYYQSSKFLKTCFELLGKLRKTNLFFNFLWKKLGTKLKNKLKYMDYNKFYFNLVGRTGRVVLIFDHQVSDFIKKSAEIAKNQKWYILSLPHAIDNWDNEYIDTNINNIFATLNYGHTFNIFDVVVFPNKYVAERFINTGLESKRVSVVGSTRFSKEWMYKLKTEVTPEYNLPYLNNKDSLKIFFPLTKPTHSIFEDEVKRYIDIILKFENVVLVVKPHTRGMKFSSNTKLPKNCYIAKNDIPSQVLIDWSDLTIFSATSVILDNLIKDKPVVYLKRTVANKLIFERFVKTWDIECKDQLINLIKRMIKDKSIRTYSVDEKNLCVNQLVFGQNKNLDIIKAYTDIIFNYLERRTDGISK